MNDTDACWLEKPPDGGDTELALWLLLPGYIVLDTHGRRARWPLTYAEKGIVPTRPAPARWTTLTIYFGFIAALLALIVLLAPAASADPGADQKFIDRLHNAGLDPGLPDVAINNGHIVCGNLWAGGTTDDQVQAIRQVEPALTVPQIRSFVAISVQTFCPDITAHYIQRSNE